MYGQPVENPEYLFVIDEFGSLLGLFKGPIPVSLLRSGFVSSYIEHEESNTYEMYTFTVAIWKDDGGLSWALVSRSNSIEDLKQVKGFR